MIISSRVRKWWASGLAMLMLVGSVLPAIQTAEAAPDNSNVVISQVYGGGGNSGAEFKNDFIELYNPTNKPVVLTGWKVRYTSATGTFSSGTELTGTIPANGYYLVQEAAGTGGIAALPTPDAAGILAMSGTNGKVDLVDPSNNTIDLVGYGTATGVEGTPTPALTNATAAIRKAAAGAPADSRGLDTDNNVADFVVQAANPRNSSYGKAPETASSVVASPAANAWPVGTEISLNSPTVGASVYSAVYRSGGSTDFQPYTGPITLTEDTTIKAYASEPNMPNSAITTFDYTILTKTDVATARLGNKGQNISTEGIVTHINAAKMYIQDGTGGIVLYGFPEFANVGDRVAVSGEMDIYSNLQELKLQSGLQYSVVASDVGVPAPKLITATDLSAANGENHEAQLVTMNNVTIDNVNGNTVTASQGGQQFTIFSTLPKLVKGATFDSITGVIEQYNTTYQFIPLNENALVEETFSVMASPGAGRIIKGSAVTLSSPTLGAQIHYTTDGTEPTAASKLYSDPITVSKDLTINAIVVADGKTSKVYTFAYKASDLPRIHDIQGESHASEYVGQNVTDVEGIVTQYGYTFATGAYRGFFMQDPQPDNNVNTSEGIFVYSTNASLKPKVGDLVRVNGAVSEYNEGSASNLTSTQINMTSLTVDSSSSYTVPEPIVLGKGGRAIPSSIIDNDSMADFEPSEDAIDFYESLEGMLVKLPTPTIISPYWTSGSGNSMLYNIPTRVENDTPDLITPAGGLVLKEYNQFNPQRLIIAYGNPGQEVITGDKFAGDVTGVIGYNNGNFKVIPENGKLPTITPSTFKQETTTLEVNEDKLLIASYNIENFYPGVGATKIQKLADSITNNMKKPDIIGVVEMQDSNGETNNGITEASADELIKAIETAGGPVYKYTDIAPVNNQDGGAPGGNIRVGFLYNPARVQLADSVNGQKGTSTQSVAYDAATDKLTYNPGRIDPTNAAFASSRKPLAAQFIFGGEKVIVIANHFNSKGGDNGPFGNVQPPVLSSETQRHKIAAVVNGFVKEVLTANPEANVVALGDLNDFQFTKTATILKGTELDNLIDTLPLNEQYTYTYDGNSQVLDHILVSKNLTASSKVDVVHLNADFSPSKGRVSDHDAVVAQIDFSTAEDFPLTVLHTNDTHAGLDTVSSPNNILRRVTAIKNAKATTENPILLDAGDVFSGTLYFNKYLGQADLTFMNLVKYDAMTFGNHEFDKDSDTLSKFIGNAKFPFVSSNVNFSTDDILSKMFTNEIGRSGNAATIYPALIKEVDGEQVGIIGLTTEDTANIASPGKVTFENAVVKATETVAMLQKEKINKIIVLSHLGYEEDLKLAKAVNGIDIIVGGHSHTKLDQAVVDNSDPNAPKLIVQTGEKGLFLGQLEVKFNKDGVLTDWKDQLISIDAKNGANYVIAEDPEAKKILDTDYKPGILELSNEVVGNSEVVLNGVRDNVRTKETNLGNLIADGMLFAAKKAGTNAVIALQNGGGIRESINEGPITQGEVLGVLPFNNDLVTITLTGQEIKDAMENGVSKTPAADGRFPHVAGLKFYYDSTKPVNERVLRIEVKNGDKYVPLDLKASYEVATNAFTAKGGDFYTSLEKAYKEGRVNLLYLPDFDVFTKYLQKIGNVTANTSAVEGRIVDLKGAPLPEITEDFPLTVLHTNDTHAGLDTVSSPNNILRRVTAIKNAKATTENPILLDAGDVFSGTLYFNKYLGQADLAFMNLVKYDAMTFGNHEFDKDSDTLSKFIGKAKFPFVSSNVNFSTDDILSKMFTNEIGRSGNAATIYPALIKEVDGEQVGIIGLTTEDTANIASPGKVTFENAVVKATETVAMLQKEKINKIIVLSHLGYEEDLKLAKAVNGIDIIVGGHSHTKLDQAVVDNSDPNAPKLIVQTGEKGLFLGQLEVKFNKDGVLTDWKDQLISIDAKNGANYVIAEDPEAKKILDTDYKPGILELSNEVVGNSEVVLNGVRDNVRTKETNLGNLIADGMLFAAKKAGTNAVIALQNGGGIRESINEGPITQGEVLGVLPFNNDLVTITLTGQEIKDAMENGVSKTPAADGRFPHVAGLKFYYDSTKPVNERVLRIEVKNGDKYVPLDLKASYEVATNAFTAKGGDFYTSLEKAYKEGRVNLLYLPDFDVFTKYLKEVGNVTANTSAVEGRIVDLKGAPLPEITPTPTPVPTSPTVPTSTSTATATATATATPTTVPTAAPQVTTIDAADLTKQLAELPTGKHELVIPVKATTGGAQVELPGSVLVKQAAAQPNTILTLTTDGASYSLPLSVINSVSLAAQLGTSDFTITVSILLADSKTLSSTNQAIASQLGNATLAAPVIEFSVSAVAGSKRVPLNNFGSTYVNRTINVPTSLNSNSATAVVFDPATGKISFVPAIFAPKANGTTDVTIKRNSNSYYTVVKSSKTFGDISGHWAKASIDLLASKLIVSGTNSDTFSPSQSITRAEFAALITRSLGLVTTGGETTFKDVNPSAWYADAIRTAAEAELISGYTDGSFKPGSPITRQEMASVLAKAIKYTGKTLNADPAALAKFSDAASIPAWSQAAVAEIAAEGIIQGAKDGSFAPQKLATRAEAVTMLEKTLKSLQFIN
ncbi:5'-nucleotidase C-terminal domain-containing protein [Paenibacillus sp. FSL R5-0470]|uniref:5'-nucleotidase C-terminal domain-containing protein n=1 Tax=Paenibacillus sp. FSL R5-0470 TaxID=2921641 RepID=UPI0030DB8CDF